MKHSIISSPGYLIIDHSASPGLTAEENAKAGRPPEAATGTYEADVTTCGHCPMVLLLTPFRKEDPAWCSYCDRYICKSCNVVYRTDGQCRNLNTLLDKMHEDALKALNVKEI